MMPKGLTDKLYWRETRPGFWHCFKATGLRTPRYEALCGREELYWVGGQDCRRPNPLKRCGVCDGLEMKRRGWVESGPESSSRKKRCCR